MDMRSRISQALKDAMRAKEADRLSTLRLITAAFKDRDIAARGEGEEGQVSDDVLLGILARMVKQRQVSARAYEEGGRLELAQKELSEIGVIEEFLPRQLTESETQEAISAAIAEVDANSIRDMGRVMAVLKGRYAGQMDFGRVGPEIRVRLG